MRTLELSILVTNRKILHVLFHSTKKIINIVISSLNDHFKDLAGRLASALKRKGCELLSFCNKCCDFCLGHYNPFSTLRVYILLYLYLYFVVVVKIQNDIQPEKTSICITSSCLPQTNDGWYFSSQSRTLKTIRASLYGIPIVSPEWIILSLERNEIQVPKGDLCIRTLPCKVDYWKNFSDTSAQFGVAKYAAHLQKRKALLKPLENVCISICGMTQGPQKSDAQTVIRDSGAKLVSLSVMMRQLLSKSSYQIFVLLCSKDSDDGIASQHKKLIDAISSGSKVLVVGFAWLFDTVSCGTVIEDIRHYCPESPDAKDLWERLLKLYP